jgi:hypothetical protein
MAGFEVTPHGRFCTDPRGWRPKIYREEFRYTIGLGALYNYSLVRTKRRARAHILSSTVKVCG